MKCNNCGNEINEGDAYCNKCGKKPSKQTNKRKKRSIIISIIIIITIIILLGLYLFILRPFKGNTNSQTIENTYSKMTENINIEYKSENAPSEREIRKKIDSDFTAFNQYIKEENEANKIFQTNDLVDYKAYIIYNKSNKNIMSVLYKGLSDISKKSTTDYLFYTLDNNNIEMLSYVQNKYWDATRYIDYEEFKYRKTKYYEMLNTIKSISKENSNPTYGLVICTTNNFTSLTDFVLSNDNVNKY